MMVRRLRHLLAGAVLAALFLPVAPPPASAQESLSAAAVVNDQVISVLDLEMRTRLVLLSAGLPNSAEQRQRVAPQVLRTLIDEQLQIQEAERLGYEVSDEEIDEAMAQIARGNNMSLREFLSVLEQSGVLAQTFRDQVRANIAWQSLMGQEIRPQIQISEGEIEEVVERLRAQDGQRQMRVREIFLAADESTDLGEVQQTAERLMREIGAGADFASLAQQFSQSATAPVGGDLGWVTAESLPSEVAEDLRQMQPGEVVGPVRAYNGFYIMELLDTRRITAGADYVDLRQVFVELSNGTAGEDVDRAKARMRDLRSDINGCGAIEQLAEATGGLNAGDLGRLSLADLPDEIREEIEPLQIGEPSEPIQLEHGIAVLMICDRETAGVNRDEIRRNLLGEQMNLMAQRYMRDLRRQANIDVRL